MDALPGATRPAPQTGSRLPDAGPRHRFEALQGVLADGDLPSIRWRLGWADRSRLEPFHKVSRTLKEHFHGILACLQTRLTNVTIEAANGLLQMAKRPWLSELPLLPYRRLSQGLRLNLQLPHPLPT